jgi:tetratricopeptide (TPR) repeat protein
VLVLSAGSASANPIRADVLSAPDSLVDSGLLRLAVPDAVDTQETPSETVLLLQSPFDESSVASDGLGPPFDAARPDPEGSSDTPEAVAPPADVAAEAVELVEERLRSPVEERQEPLALFRSVLILPLPSSVDAASVAIDSSHGTVDISPSPPEEWLERIATRLEHSQMIDQLLVSEDGATMVFSSLSTTAIVVQAFPLQTKYLVVGDLRSVPNPRRHFMGARCASSLLEPSNIELAAAISDYCADDSLRELATLEGTSSISGAERQVATVLRYEASAVSNLDGARRLGRLTTSGVGVQSRVAAATATAFGHALRDELPAALDALRDAERNATGSTEHAELTRVTIREFGFALFDRLIGAAHESGEPLASVYYAERFEDWNVERLPADSRRRLGDAYGALNMPARAASLYLSAYSSGSADNYALLAQLAESYYAAGDNFRAIETVEFLRERAPAAPETIRVSALLRERGLADQTTCAERAVTASDSVSLFAVLHCAREAGDRGLVESVSARLRTAELELPVFGDELTDLLVRDALRSVVGDRAVR